MPSKWQSLAQTLSSQRPLDSYLRQEIGRDLAGEIPGLTLYPLSVERIRPGQGLFAASDKGHRRLVTLDATGRPQDFATPPLARFRRERLELAIHSASTEAINGLAEFLPHLRARTGLPLPAIGLGDRLGLATPAHVRAVEEGGMTPYFALQAPAELAEAGRSWADALADALWGVLREGWTGGFGADADQLQDEADIEAAAAAGYSRFTIDLAPWVESAEGLDRPGLSRRFVEIEEDIPAATAWRKALLGKTFTIQMGYKKETIALDERTFLVTAARYARACTRLADRIRIVAAAMRGRPYEIEVSFFNVPAKTQPEEHLFVALVLAEMGLPIHAVAPRFVGRFARCVEYKGNSSKLMRNIALHAGIARLVDNHALAIHSGSDKFSIYSRLAEACDGRYYLKTSGTSYVEALRVAARHDRPLFEAIVEAAYNTLAEGSTVFDVAIDPARLGLPSSLDDDDLESAFLGTGHGRHLLCESSQTVLSPKSPLRARLVDLLHRREEEHFAAVSSHLRKHML